MHDTNDPVQDNNNNNSDSNSDGNPPLERQGFWPRIRIPVAAAAALVSVAGIVMAVFGLVEFDHQKTTTGVAIIVVSTIIYITILARDRNPRK